MDIRTQRNALLGVVAALLVLVGLLAGGIIGTGAAGGVKGPPDGVPGNAKGFDRDEDGNLTIDEENFSLDPDFLGQNVVGPDAFMQGLNIHASNGNPVVYSAEGQYPAGYSGNADNPLVNGCAIPGGVIFDTGVDGDPYQRTHDYRFTFTTGQPVSTFSVGVVDWGDLLPFGTTDNINTVTMTALNADGNVVDTDTFSFETIGDATTFRDTTEFGNTRQSGDACTAELGQPGRFILSVRGSGITEVTINFDERSSIDPATALWVGPLEFTVAEGVGTQGFWQNRGLTLGWPLTTDEYSIDGTVYSVNGNLVMGGVEYTASDAVAIIKTDTGAGYEYAIFQQLAAAKLNVLAGNEASCITDTIAEAEQWLTNNPIGSGADSSVDNASAINDQLTAYNEGSLCATSRDAQ